MLGNLIFKKLAMEDKPILDKYFKDYQPKISEYTFSNLFIWGSPKEVSYAIYHDGLLFTITSEKEHYFLSPLGFDNYEKIFGQIADYSIQKSFGSIKLIPEFQKKFAIKTGSLLTEDPNNFDYVYKTKSLVELKGNKFDGKRGFVKKFREKYNFSYISYDNTYKDKCMNLLEKWMGKKTENNPSITEEYNAMVLFFDHFDHLNSQGGLIMVDQDLAAFSFGEKLNDSAYVVHFEKANSSFTGSYQIINQEFTKNEVLGKFDLINREQDLGIEGIRKAKLSYNPLKLIKKYTLSF